MKNQRFTVARNWLPSLGLVIGLAMAPTAFAGITAAQEAKVKVGMSMDDVRQLLGAPNNVTRVRYSPGPTWIYEASISGRAKHYELDFDGAGKVMWIETHDLPDN